MNSIQTTEINELQVSELRDEEHPSREQGPSLSAPPGAEFLANSSAPTRGGGQKLGEENDAEGGIDAIIPPHSIKSAFGGRPRILNEGLKALLCQLLSDGLSRRQAAIALDIVHSTIANEMVRDTAFAAKVAKAEELSVIKPLQAIARASEKNWRAAAWLMARNENRLRRMAEKKEE